MILPDDLKGKHFLICDDYESMRIMMKDSLVELGVSKISQANSGNQGFRLIQESLSTAQPIQFVITDLMMADGSGLDLVKMIRADQQLLKLPIVMVTSKAEVSHVLECVKAGVNNYITKPWQVEDLGKKLVETGKKLGV